MKSKLTITVDKEVVTKAKSRAKMSGKSLSAVIEDLLRSEQAKHEPTFAERWAGKFVPAKKKTARYKYLAKRYGL